MPVTVMAGPDHTRDPRVPVPMRGRSSQDLGQGAELLLGAAAPGPFLAQEAFDGDVTLVVVQ